MQRKIISRKKNNDYNSNNNDLKMVRITDLKRKKL